MPTSKPSSSSSSSMMKSRIKNKILPSESSIILQDRLHELLTRISSSIDLVRTWPEASSNNNNNNNKEDDSVSIHIKSTSKLIDSIRSIINALDRVEHVLKENTKLREKLNNCYIPLNLLDLLDHGGGLNPECFARGLMEEALGQLEGLKRRKFALQRLGTAVQIGLQKKIKDQEQQITTATATATTNKEEMKHEQNNSVRNNTDNNEVNPTTTRKRGLAETAVEEEEEEDSSEQPAIKKMNLTIA